MKSLFHPLNQYLILHVRCSAGSGCAFLALKLELCRICKFSDIAPIIGGVLLLIGVGGYSNEKCAM